MSTTSKTVYKQDGTTTYCYYSTHTYDSPLSNVAKADIQSATSGTPCPVQLTVTVPPTSVDKNSLIALKMTAVISDKDKPASFEFPGAGNIPSAAVPSYIGTSSANNTNSTAAASGTKKFQVPVANFFICDYRNCDAFSDTSVLQGNKYASTNNPQNFDGTTATFESNELMAAKDGKYTGIAHIGMYLTPESRLDFVTYFPVQIGDVPGAVDTIKADATSTYCWVTKKHTPFETSLEESYMSIHTNTLCPGTMSAALSKTSVVVGEEFTVDFGLQLETTRDPATIIGEVSPTDAVFNPSTNLWSVVPVAVFGACLQNSDDKTKTCSTYTGTKSRTRDVASFYDRNLTAGAVKYSTKTSFNEPGKYLLISRVAMETLDGDRIDMAVYSNINVAIPATKSGGMFLYIGLGIGLLILVIGFAFCFMRKRRARRQMKEIPFRTPMPPASVVQDRSSQYTATSSNFVTHRSPQMKIAYPQYDNNSFYPAQGNDGYGDYRDKHKDSFSLDPYRRNSFNEIGDGESIDMTIRPSDASKFSFQTGYDDQQDWEYDTQSYRSEKTDYSDVQRGTFHLNTNGGGQLPIMEEDDRDHHRGGNNHTRHFEPQSVGRSTTSSEWTVRG